MPCAFLSVKYILPLNILFNGKIPELKANNYMKDGGEVVAGGVDCTKRFSDNEADQPDT